MRNLMKFLALTILALTCSISVQAITLKEFITKCDTICDVTPIKLSSDSTPQLKKEKVDEIIVFQIGNIGIDKKQKIIDIASTITKTEDMLVVKHNEDNTDVQVFIQPRGENIEMAVTVFNNQMNVIVYLIGSAELLQQDNIVNIGGKDLIKEALKGIGQKE